jgi:alpha-L-fucosidase
VIDGITAWMAVNSEGIYSTRPWKIFGEGPSTLQKVETGNFNEDKQKDLAAEDVRFTTKGNSVYAFVMGRPETAVVNALGLWSPQQPGKIERVQILGHGGNVKWEQANSALRVSIPEDCASKIGLTLKVDLA